MLLIYPFLSSNSSTVIKTKHKTKISPATTHLLIGDRYSPIRLGCAKAWKIPIWDDEELFKFVRESKTRFKSSNQQERRKNINEKEESQHNTRKNYDQGEQKKTNEKEVENDTKSIILQDHGDKNEAKLPANGNNKNQKYLGKRKRKETKTEYMNKKKQKTQRQDRQRKEK